MNEEEIKLKLKGKGCPDFVWKGGGASLIENWKKFIEEVKKGYESTIYDYQNDLDTRNLIRFVQLDEKVKDLDEQFVSLLTRTDLRVWKSSFEVADDFWNFGYPKNASEELIKDAEALSAHYTA